MGNRFLELKLLGLLAVVGGIVLVLTGAVALPGFDRGLINWNATVVYAVACVVALVAGILFALELPRGVRHFIASGHSRRMFRIVWNWQLLLAALLLLAGILEWHSTYSTPYISEWYETSAASPPPGKSGTYARIVETKFLIRHGSIWFEHAVALHDQSQTLLPLGSNHWVSPSSGGGGGGGGGITVTYPESRFVGFDGQWKVDPLGWWVSAAIPFWLAFVPFALILTRQILRTRKPKNSVTQCPCGYDLRAHRPGGKCPECGTVIPRTDTAIISPK